jgi:hypothetical protein
MGQKHGYSLPTELMGAKLWVESRGALGRHNLARIMLIQFPTLLSWKISMF